MRLAQAIKVHVDREALVGRTLVVEALQQNAIGAQVDVALARDSPLDQFGQLRIDGRFTATDRHYRRTGFIHCLQALGQGQPVFEVTGVALGRAPHTGEITGVEGFEHEDHGIAGAALEFILGLPLEHVGDDVPRKPHCCLPP